PTAPSLLDVERIANLGDPVLRNLLITQCYHVLSAAFVERSGLRANWCTFAAWASKQAGQTIRKEDLSRALESDLRSDALVSKTAQELQALIRRVGVRLEVEEILTALWKAYDPQQVFERSSAAVARGNLKVFAEIAREFARFETDCLPDASFDEQRIAAFVESLRPGDPPEGQEYLRRAFRHYYLALFEVDEKPRTELLLLANLEIGFHEQVRLQPEINEALDAPVISPQSFAQNLLGALLPNGGRLAQAAWWLLRLLGRLTDFDRAAALYVTGAQRQAQALVTGSMMSIELGPGIRLRLGDDLRAAFPPVLLTIANPDLRFLLGQIDPTPDSPGGSGALEWGDFAERIHFIADMFRCYEVSAGLFEPPFSPEQTAAIQQGRLPDGRL
ncbi:MAG TPA: hypothetical protein PJ988_01435, partial [Anaerolinea sp.]|nr:hypothetical protein [Anaerolinea sp.]